MPHDGADEEAVVCGLGARLHLGSTQVEVHLVVGTGDGRQVEVAHAAQLQLEGQRRLQVPVDAVLCELGTGTECQGPAHVGRPRSIPEGGDSSYLVPGSEREKLWEFSLEKKGGRQNIDKPGTKRVFLRIIQEINHYLNPQLVNSQLSLPTRGTSSLNAQVAEAQCVQSQSPFSLH